MGTGTVSRLRVFHRNNTENRRKSLRYIYH